MRSLLACALLLIPALASAQQPSAQAIMARVAANQDKAEAERAHFVYVQHARIVSRKGKTVHCEEITDSRVTPTAQGSQQHLLKIDGRLLRKSKYVTYDALPPSGNSGETDVDAGHKDLDISLDDQGDMDRDLVENMRHNLTTDSSKDGLAANLFPLTTKEQADTRFVLLGRELRNGRDCFHISFTPKDKDDFGWKGDAWIDTAAYQPVVVRTTMARKIPFAVRAFLGTNVPGLGFTIVYAPQAAGQADDVWFPTSFGTEFKLRVLFFLNRQIAFNAENRNFQKTHVTAEIVEK